jgi:flagellar assembly protein FliH
MSLSTSSAQASPDPVIDFEYPDLGRPMEVLPVEDEVPVNTEVLPQEPDVPEGFISVDEMEQRLAETRHQALQEGERHGLLTAQAQLEKHRAQIGSAVEDFQREVSGYYSRIEAEVVNLSLSIAAKILHREANVDRMLVAALVKVAIAELHQETKVVVRVPPSDLQQWTQYFTENTGQSLVTVQVVADAAVEQGNCVLETDLGTAELGIDAQLKEIERGFFDLLAQRPDPK